MGSSTYTVEVTEEELLAQKAANKNGRSIYHYGNRDYNSVGELASDVAHDKWRDDWDAERGSAYVYPALVTRLVPEELANQVMFSQNRGKNTLVVPLMKKSDYVVKKKTLTVKLTDKEWKDHVSSYSQDVLFAKARELFPEAQNSIFSVRVVVPGEDPQKTYWNRRKSDGWKVQSRVDADTSGGKSKTVFHLVADNQKLKQEFESQALARAAATKLLQTNLDVTSVKVEATVRREDDTALVKLNRVVSSATAKIEIQYTKVTKATPARDGLLVELWYHS